MKQTIKVSGMSCSHCVLSVKGSVSDLDGIESVDVNLEDGLVTVVYDEVKVELTHIKHAIEEQGFDVLT